MIVNTSQRASPLCRPRGASMVHVFLE